MNSRALAASLLVAVAVWSPCVVAQPTEAERETARSLMDEGDRLVAGSDLVGALKRYEAAHEIMGVPTTGIEVARTRAKLGKLVEARALAIEVANSPITAKEPSVFGEARSEAAKLAEHLEGRIPSVTVTINPDGLTNLSASIEGTRLPEAALGLPIKVNPGEHSLEVAAQGYLTENVPFTVLEGEQRSLAVTLTLAPTVAPAAGGSPTSSVPAASNSSPTQDSGQAKSYTATYVAFGVAGAAALVGGGAGIYSLMKTRDAEEFCSGNSCTSKAEPLLDDATTYAWVANIGLGVAVLAAGYGVYSLLSGEDEAASRTAATASPALSVAVTPRLDGASLIYGGAF